MTDEQLQLASLIREGVDALNNSMEQFEKRRLKESENARAKYVAETEREGFLPLKWWR
jgi:hypothetical protein